MYPNAGRVLFETQRSHSHVKTGRAFKEEFLKITESTVRH